MNSETKKELNRLVNVKGNKDKSEVELVKQAQVNIAVRDYLKSTDFVSEKERDFCKSRFKSYLDANELDTASEIDNLQSLIFQEVLENRVQKELNKLAKEGKIPPEKITKQLNDIQNQKLTLKSRLKLDKEDEKKDELTGLEVQTKRLNKYINEHKEEFTFTCTHGTPHLLRRRVADFDSMKHPWFAGRWLFNYEILKDVKSKKITKEDAWRYLSCASQGGAYKQAFDKKYCVDYINYCIRNWGEITEHLESN